MIGVLVSGNGTNLQALIDAGLPVSAVGVEPQGRLRARARTRGRHPDGDVRASSATPTATSAIS